LKIGVAKRKFDADTARADLQSVRGTAGNGHGGTGSPP
jgi:hypothetical protein